LAALLPNLLLLLEYRLGGSELVFLQRRLRFPQMEVQVLVVRLLVAVMQQMERGGEVEEPKQIFLEEQEVMEIQIKMLRLL
jgi:hypothetical protein